MTLKPCSEMTPDERAAVLAAIRSGRIGWPYRNSSGSDLTLSDVEAHGQIDRDRGVVFLGGIGFEIRIRREMP